MVLGWLVLAVCVVAVDGAMASGDAVGVCITGLQRTLLEAPVVESFEAYVRGPILSAGGTLETFVVLADEYGRPGVAEAEGRTASRGASQLAAVARAYAAVSARALAAAEAPEDELARCLPTEADMQGLRATSKRIVSTLRQFYGIRACYRDVVAREAATRRRYAWLYRLRTDLVFFMDFAPFRLTPPDGDPAALVYVGLGGMSSDARFACLNDHFFACPRGHCRAYFELLELFEDGHCRRQSSLAPPCDDPRTTNDLSAACPRDGLDLPSGGGFRPTSPYSVSRPLPHTAGQHYWFRRYGGAKAGCYALTRARTRDRERHDPDFELDRRRGPKRPDRGAAPRDATRESPPPPLNDTVATDRLCCGNIRQLRIPYTIAYSGGLGCERRLRHEWADYAASPFFDAASFVPRCERVNRAWLQGGAVA